MVDESGLAEQIPWAQGGEGISAIGSIALNQDFGSGNTDQINDVWIDLGAQYFFLDWLSLGFNYQEGGNLLGDSVTISLRGSFGNPF